MVKQTEVKSMDALSANTSAEAGGNVVELITDVEMWSSQREHWQEILDAGTDHTPYQQFDWLYNWWCNFGNGLLYIVRVNDRSGRVLGYAPLYIRPATSACLSSICLLLLISVPTTLIL